MIRVLGGRTPPGCMQTELCGEDANENQSRPRRVFVIAFQRLISDIDYSTSRLPDHPWCSTLRRERQNNPT